MSQLLLHPLQELHNIVSHWYAWVLGIGALVAGLSWIPGVGTVLTIAVAGLQLLTPILSALLQAVIWAWQTIFFPGLRNILTNITSILTVVTIVAGAWLWFAARYEIQHLRDQHTINRCINRIPAQSTKEEPDDHVNFSLPWPLSILQ